MTGMSALVGRSLWRIEQAARETGYLADLPPFLTDEEAGYLPRDKVLLICTGSQGEPRSALARIAEDEHPDIALEAGRHRDLLLAHHPRQRARHRPAAQRARQRSASRSSPSTTISSMSPAIRRRTSFSACTRLVQPAHRGAGAWRGAASCGRMRALAEECQVRAGDGDRERRDGEARARRPAAVIGEVPTGRLVADGKRCFPLGGEALKSRQRMTFNGAALATIVVDAEGRLAAPPQVTVHGLAEHDAGENAGAGTDRSRAARRRAEPGRARGRCGGARGGTDRRAPLAQRPPRQAAADRGACPASRPSRKATHDRTPQSCRDRRAGLRRRRRSIATRSAPASRRRAAAGAWRHRRLRRLCPIPRSSCWSRSARPRPCAGFSRATPPGGMHHLCYEVADIRAARDRLKSPRARASSATASRKLGRPRQAGAVPAPQGFLRHPDRAGAGVRA